MFSGIVQGIAEVVSIKGSDNDKQISFTFPKDFALTNLSLLIKTNPCKLFRK